MKNIVRFLAAPWTDFDGNVLLDGDKIVHPDGAEGYIGFDESKNEPEDQWRVIYMDGVIGRLCLQVGHKGMAIKVIEQANSDLPILSGRQI